MPRTMTAAFWLVPKNVTSARGPTTTTLCDGAAREQLESDSPEGRTIRRPAPFAPWVKTMPPPTVNHGDVGANVRAFQFFGSTS